MRINPSFYEFQTESLVMRTSAKKTLYSEALIFILELLSQVKSDCHENCQEPRFVDVFKMIRGFF